MTLSSLPVLVIGIFLFFVLPFSVWKAFYDRHFPLQKLRLPLPKEIVHFYLPFLVSSFGITFFIFHLAGYGPDWPLINAAIFPDTMADLSAHRHMLGVQLFFGIQNVLFFMTLLIMAILGGHCSGWSKAVELKGEILKNTDLFNISGAELIGFWSALLKPEKPLIPFLDSPALSRTVFVDVLIDSNILYSGRLFHYSIENGRLASLALKDTQRFLVESIHAIAGKNEPKYNIPGKITYFSGDKIKNINIREIIEERDDTIFLGADLKTNSLDEIIKDLEKEVSQKNPKKNRNTKK